MKINSTGNKKNAAAVLLGSSGGKATVKNNGKEYMKKLSKKGARVRWGKGKKTI